jgi:hypothetical protein
MPSSEIDDIFASKGKCKPCSTASSLEKKKQDKSSNSTDSRNRPTPEIVVDSSTLIPDGKSAKIGKGINSGLKTGNKDKSKDSFRDSRGCRPRVYYSSSNVL